MNEWTSKWMNKYYVHIMWVCVCACVYKCVVAGWCAYTNWIQQSSQQEMRYMMNWNAPSII